MKELRGTSYSRRHASVGDILEAAQLLKKKDVQLRLQQLEELKRSLEETLEKLLGAVPMVLGRAEFAGGASEFTVEQRIVRALNPTLASCIGLEIIANGLEAELEMTRLQLNRLGPTRPGAQKHLAAYEVAYFAARLFAVVTGDKPTYSEEHSGGDSPAALYGRFTPLLRDIFDALGWKKTDAQWTGPEGNIQLD